MKGKCAIVLVVVFLFGSGLSVGFLDLAPRLPAWENSRSLHWLGLACLAAWFVVMVVSFVLCARHEDKQRQSSWASERGSISLRNVFWPRVRFLLIGGVIITILVGVVGLLAPHLVLPPPAAYVVWVALLMIAGFAVTTFVLYSHEQNRIAELAYLHFAKEFGVPQETLRKVTENPEFHRKTFPGVWAETIVDHRGHPVHFAGEQTRRPNGYGGVPLFVLSVERPGKPERSEKQLLQEMGTQSRESLARIRRTVPRTKMACSEGRIFLMMPVMNTDTTVDLLRNAMDMLVKMPGC